MNNSLLKLIGILMACILGGAACSTAPSKPGWIGRNWEDSSQVYFSGIASNGDSVQKVREIAYANALQSFVEYIGMKLQIKIESNLTESGQNLESNYLAVSKEVFIKNIIVDKFEFFKERGKFTGYILIRIPKKEIAEAKAYLQQQEVAIKQEQIRKQHLGAFQVQTPKEWSELKTLFENKLSQQGYKISRKGKVVQVRVSQFACKRSELAQIMICTVSAGVRWNEKEQNFEVKGYGNDLPQAQKDALQMWIEKLPENILENL